MLTSILILLFLLPLALLPCILDFFSSCELRQMGIALENADTDDAAPCIPVAFDSLRLCL